ncbi:MAG: nucleoside triphosphate pyrophosphohydrolase [Pseudomonadota bacterium]
MKRETRNRKKQKSSQNRLDQERLSKALLNLYGIMSRLRGPDGCPWDAQQTDSSVKMYLLEEAYEVLDAVERGGPEAVCQELGDLLFQILFLARLAEERGEFALLNVMEGVGKKMIHRHPHVFGTGRLESPEEVAENWARIKDRERGTSEPMSSQLRSVPMDLPALLRAHRLIERVSKTGFYPSDGSRVWEKIEEALQVLKRSLLSDDRGGLGEGLGHLIFYLVDLARCWDLNAEHLLREINRKFIDDVEKRMDEETTGSPEGMPNPPKLSGRNSNGTTRSSEENWSVTKKRKP